MINSIEESTNNPYPIEEHTFNAWLAAKGDDDTIGICQNRHDCMFSTFLRETYGKAFVVIYEGSDNEIAKYSDDEYRYEYRYGYNGWPVPEWAMPKMRVFDYYLYDDQTFITKREFLQALEDVKALETLEFVNALEALKALEDSDEE